MKAATRKTVTDVVAFVFQSTPPVKAATCPDCYRKMKEEISIHAAREGGDLHRLTRRAPRVYISIHAAREGGDAMLAKCIAVNHISIHAAREGGDGMSKLR